MPDPNDDGFTSATRMLHKHKELFDVDTELTAQKEVCISSNYSSKKGFSTLIFV